MVGVVEIEGAHGGCQLDHRATMEGNIAQGSPVAIKVGTSDMVEAMPVRGDADHKALEGVHVGAEFINYGPRAVRAPGYS
jgi:hypothetical protein